MDRVRAMSHPAKFTTSILEHAVEMLNERLDLASMTDPPTVLDPFAGTGKGVEYLRDHGYDAIGVDLEPAGSWGESSHSGGHVYHGDALALQWAASTFDVIFTSPTYGNRFADRDMRKSCAGTYMKGLQREASEGSSCHMQWGPKYREFHLLAWNEARRVLKPGGYFLLNISDHYRNKMPQPVSAFHVEVLCELGFEWIDAKAVPAPRMKNGANAQYRCAVEWLHLFKFVA